MAVTVVQSVSTSGTTGSTLASPNLATTITGNTLVVMGYGYDGATLRTISSIAVSAGSATFAKIIAQPGIASTYTSVEGWVAPNITGGTTPHVTITYSGAVTISNIAVYELAGMPSATTTDGTSAGVAGTSNTAMVTPAITTVGSNDIIFTGYAISQSTATSTSTWTAIDFSTSDSNLSQYKIFASPQTALTVTATQNSAGTYGAIVFALKGASTNLLPTAKGALVGSAVLKVRLRPFAIGAATGVGTMFAPKRPTAISLSSSVVTTFNARQISRPNPAGALVSSGSAHGNLVQTASAVSSGTVTPRIGLHPFPVGVCISSGSIQVRLRPPITGIGAGSVSLTNRLVFRPKGIGSASGVAVITVRIRSLLVAGSSASSVLIDRTVFRSVYSGLATGAASESVKYVDRSPVTGSSVSSALVPVKEVDRQTVVGRLVGSCVVIVRVAFRPACLGLSSGIASVPARTVSRPDSLSTAIATATISNKGVLRPDAIGSLSGVATVLPAIPQLTLGTSTTTGSAVPRLFVYTKPKGVTLGTTAVSPRTVWLSLTAGASNSLATQVSRTVGREPSAGSCTSISSMIVRFGCRPQALATTVSTGSTVQEIGGLYRPIALAAADGTGIATVRVRYLPKGSSAGSASISTKLTPIRPVSLASAVGIGAVLVKLVCRPSAIVACTGTVSLSARLTVHSVPFGTTICGGSVTPRQIVRSIPLGSAAGSGVTTEELGGTSRPKPLANAQGSVLLVARVRPATSAVSIASSTIGVELRVRTFPKGAVSSVGNTTIRLGGNIAETILGAAAATAGVATFRLRAPALSSCVSTGTTGAHATLLRPSAIGTSLSSSLTGQSVKVGILRPLSAASSAGSASTILRGSCRPGKPAASTAIASVTARLIRRTQVLSGSVATGQAGVPSKVGVFRAGSAGVCASSSAWTERLVYRSAVSGIVRSTGLTVGHAPYFPTAIASSVSAGQTGEATKVGVRRNPVTAISVSTSAAVARSVIRGGTAGFGVGSGTDIRWLVFRPISIGSTFGIGTEIQSGTLAQRFNAIVSCSGSAIVGVRLVCKPSPSGMCAGIGSTPYKYLYYPTANASAASFGSYNGGRNQRITLEAGAITMSMVAGSAPSVQETVASAISTSVGSILFESIQTITGGGNSARTAVIVLRNSPTIIRLSQGSSSPVSEA